MLKIAVLYFFLLITCTTTAQQYSIYQGITTSNGLPSNYVFAVCEDENGFLWAGTDKGLCRYNGFSWQVWDKDNGLPGNYINTIISDKKGSLWLGISDKGLYSFNIAKGTTKKIDVSKYNIDKNGNIFFNEVSKTNGSVSIYLIAAGSKSAPEKVYEYTPNADVNMMADAKSKKVFCITKSKKLSSHNLKYKGKWNLVYRALPDNDINRTIFFANDTLIITNSHYYKFSKEGELLKSITIFNDNNNYAVGCITTKGSYIADVKTGYYFISNANDKVFYNSKSGLGSDYVNNVYEMKDGTIAFATLGAGLQFIKNYYKKSFSTGNRVVRSIVNAGQSWYALAGDKVFVINPNIFSLTEMGNVASSALHLYKFKNDLLIGSLKGIDFYALGQSPDPYHSIPYNAGISSILRNNGGFIASTYGGGLISFNNRNVSIKRIDTSMPIIEKTIPLQAGYAMLSYEDGLIIKDTITQKKIQLKQEDGLLSNSVYSLYQHNDTIWICTKAGLNIYTRGKIAKTISFNSGFTGGKAMYSFHDKHQRLWVVSDKFLHLYNNGKLNALTSHPLTSDNNDLINTAAYDPQSDVLATGTLKGVSFITLSNVQPNNLVDSPRLLAITVDGKIRQSKNLTVPYQFNHVDFHLAPFASSPLSQGKFYYNLKGRDNVWREVKDSLTLSFSALRPGSYKLLSKIKNADGYENSTIELSSFIVEKPYWQQWPFILFCIVAVAVGTTALIKVYDKQKRKKEEVKLVLQKSLQNERERISKDLHDHLGANLATIIAQTDNIEARLYKGDIAKASTTVQHLSSQTRETMNVLRETIWAVQETEHSLEDFIIRIRTFLQRLFESTTIQWEVKISTLGPIILSPTQTLHLFRIVQEVSQNILKHSGANMCIYIFTVVDNVLGVEMSDDGRGFDLDSDTNTNGITNIKERVQILGGTIKFSKEIGTAIHIQVPL